MLGPMLGPRIHFFQISNYFQFFSQIELYHCTKSQKSPQSGFSKKDMTGF